MNDVTNTRYISGLGKDSVVPPEIKRWNWGAFFLNWVWGIGNSAWIALLTLVPVFGWFIMPFVLGAKGSEWAWRNRTWRDVDHFRSVQKKWSIAGVIAFFVSILAFTSFISDMSAHYDAVHALSLAAIQKDVGVSDQLGQPVHAIAAHSMSIQTNGEEGDAALQYQVSGPKGTGLASVTAVMQQSQWVLQEVYVDVADANVRIQVVTKIGAVQTQ